VGGSASLDLLVVGAGPTGIAIGAEAVQRGVDVLLLDKGPLLSNLLGFPTFMNFFTTRDLLEIAGIPFAVPEDKPSRRQALTYYQSVVGRFDIPLAPHEEFVTAGRDESGCFRIVSRRDGRERVHRAKAVALATGYFHNPRRLGVDGEDLPWVHRRYLDPYRHFGERVVVVGGGNSAIEAALEMWRNGVEVTLVHRAGSFKPGVKYWLKPDVENRIREESIDGRFDSRVLSFGSEGVEIEGPRGRELVATDAAYVLIGYKVDVKMQRDIGIEVAEETWVPNFDPRTCETNVPGLYVAGTLQAGIDTGRIFIENSRDHGKRILDHLTSRLGS